MSEWKHGAYGEQQAAGSRVTSRGQNAMVVIGTAPVHTVAGGAKNVNKAMVVNDIAEARKLFGYDDNWADYTLCEAMQMFFVNKGIGPLVLINVLDPVKHKKAEKESKTLTPVNGRMTLAGAESIILDSVLVADKEKGTDYSIAYNDRKKALIITETAPGALGASEVQITYETVDPAQVTSDDVIGESDGNGLNTGIYCMKNVYQETGYVPAFLLAPGYSSIPEVHDVMWRNSQKINKHWDAWMFADLPLVDEAGTSLTMDTAHTWRKEHGYDKENETVCFPMAEGTDGRKYHLSVIRAANFAEVLAENDGIPYHSASNTEAAIIANLWLGEENRGRIWDDSLINEKLCKNGISSAAFMGGRWAVWGASAADYDSENGDEINVAETTRMMLYYITNGFQQRHARDVDKPLSANDVQTLVAEEQARLDALVKIGALTYGVASLNADAIARSDMYSGDFMFTFNVTTTPLAKSLTAYVNWVDDGFSAYYAAYSDAV